MKQHLGSPQGTDFQSTGKRKGRGEGEHKQLYKKSMPLSFQKVGVPQKFWLVSSSNFKV